MKTISKILFYSSIIFMVLCLLIDLIIKYTGFEFEDDGDGFSGLVLFAIPLAFMFTLFGLGFNSKKQETPLIAFRVILTIVAALLFFVFTLFDTALDLCVRTYSPSLFVLRQDSNVTIQESSFGCGAVDSTSPSTQIVKIEKYPLGFIYVQSIDTNTIDKSKWTRVSHPNK